MRVCVTLYKIDRNVLKKLYKTLILEKGNLETRIQKTQIFKIIFKNEKYTENFAQYESPKDRKKSKYNTRRERRVQKNTITKKCDINTIGFITEI